MLAGKYHRQSGTGTITYGQKGVVIRRVIIAKNAASAVVEVRDGATVITSIDAAAATAIRSYELCVMTHIGAAVLDISGGAAEATLVTD